MALENYFESSYYNHFLENGGLVASDLSNAIFEQIYDFRPNFLSDILEAIDYFIRSDKDFRKDLLVLIDFLKTYLQLLEFSDSAESIQEINNIQSDLRLLDKELEDNKLGFFSTVVSLNISDELNNLRRKKLLIDQKNYKLDYSSPLSELVFSCFNSESDEMVMGLPQSLQGTLAASEVLSHEDYLTVLNDELNLAYPGSGCHLTPLIMAFDLIERKCISSANLLLVDIHDRNLDVNKILQILFEKNIIAEFGVDTISLNENVTTYSFKYKNKKISVYFRVGNMLDVENWDPGSRPLNVVYDHIPYQSATPGAATRILSSNNVVSTGRKVVHIMPYSEINLDHVVKNGMIIRDKRIANVSYGDKNNWTVRGDRGIGLTMALVGY